MLLLIPVYTSKDAMRQGQTRHAPRLTHLNVILPLAYRAPMSAIGRSVASKSSKSRLVLSRSLRLLAVSEEVYRRLSAPQSPESIDPSGKQAPLLPPAQSHLRLHLTLKLARRVCFLSLQ